MLALCFSFLRCLPLNPGGRLQPKPLSRVTLYEYDALDRLTAPDLTVTAIGYNSRDDVEEVTDAGGARTTYRLDDLGRVVHEDSPDLGIAGFEYDPAGNLVSRTDARGATVSYVYDALNRLIAEHYPEPALDVTYSYDQGTNGIGRLTGVTDASGLTAYAYDGLGRLVSESRANAGMPAVTMVYRYDPASGELSGMLYPSGLEITYGRGADGGIASISADGEVLLRNITYRPFGPVEDWEIVSGGAGLLHVDRTFNGRHQPDRILAGALMDYRYEYYADGGVRKISGITWPVLSPGQWDYGLASGTNRLSLVTGPYGLIQYSHDGHGNIVSDGVRTFRYDDENRLVKVMSGQAVLAEYGYDGFSRRVRKIAGGASVYYHYDTSGHLISEADESGAPLCDYIWLEDEPVAMRVYGAHPGMYFFLNDHLGTQQKLIDTAGAVVWQGDYLPFGKAHVDEDPDGDGVRVENNLRFPGQCRIPRDHIPV